MKRLRQVSAACVLTAILSSQPVAAALIDADWANLNDNLLTTDTASGLSWLDITETAGMSRDDVLAATATGGQFTGFRYATADEVIGLWSQYGITLSPATRIIENVLDDKIIAAAQQLGNLYGEIIAASDYGTLGLIEIDATSPTTTSGWSGAFRQAGQSYYEGPTIKSLAATESELWLGSYLVKPAIVPVPAAIWLFASGLLSLVGFARRRS